MINLLSYECFLNEELTNKIIDQLSKYKDDENVFIHFADINKVGIYPSQDYQDSPLGIYAFPLKKVWNIIKNGYINKLYNNKTNNIDNFKNRINDINRELLSRKYIQIIKLKNKDKHLKDLSKYSKKQFDEDILKLKKINPYEKGTTDHVLWDFYIEEEKKQTNTGDKNVTLGRGMLSFGGYKYNFRKLMQIAGVLSMHYDNNIDRENRSHVSWNTILRKIGYTSIEDNEGLGIIHPYQKYQAVFLDKSPIEHIDTIEQFK